MLGMTTDPTDECDDAIDDQPVQHLVIRAADRRAPVTTSPRSVFELALRPVRTKIRPAIAPAPQPSIIAKGDRIGGITKCVGAQYPANRWTSERDEQERLRRARQRPPKPTKKAKTMSKKLAELVGDDDGE